MASKTIIIEGNPRRVEYKAGGTIKPGHLIKLGSAGTVTVHASAGGNIYPLIAVENDLVGEDIDDSYSSGDQVQAVWACPGDKVFAFLATGNNAAIGDLLESDGAGGLQLHAVDSTGIYYHRAIVAMAAEALNNATGSQARLTVIIL